MWGTYVYARMPFRLTSGGGTLQRVMDVTFEGLIDQILVVY